MLIKNKGKVVHFSLLLRMELLKICKKTCCDISAFTCQGENEKCSDDCGKFLCL